MRIKKILLFLVLLIIMNVKNVFALNINSTKFNFNHITVEDGLSQNTVQYIFQDSYGYMWFGTEDGLNRYDGINFEYYRYSGEEGQGIASNWITYINEDSKGDIWVGTTKGLSKIDRVSEQVTTYTEKNSNLSNINICGIFIDSKERMWVFTEDGINIFDEEEENFERILYSEDKNLLTSQTIFEIVEDSKGVYWIATDNGLNSYNEVTGEIQWYNNQGIDDKYIEENFIYDIFIDQEDKLWICTLGGGLNKLDINTGRMYSYKYDENNMDSLPSNDVTSVIKDRVGKVWVGTDKGLALFNEEDESFKTYTSKVYDGATLINNNVLSLLKDKDNNIWVGTSRGISFFNPNGIFNIYKNDPFDKNTLSGNMIFGIYEDDEGLFWVGTAGNGVNVINSDDEKVYRLNEFKEFKDIVTSDEIVDINGRDDAIWIATTKELIYINKSNKEFEKFFIESNDEVRSIFIDKEGLVWIGTSDGLFSIDKEYKIKSYDKEFLDNNIKENYVSTIFEDSKGIMWIGLGVNGGLLKYNRQSGVIKQYKTIEGDESSLSYNSIKDINEDSKGNIWVGTNYALNKYNAKDDNFTRYTELDGLINDFVYGILIDDNDNLWLSTNGGISRYDIEKNNFINFNVRDGLQSNEFNNNASFKAKNGMMLFGGVNGLNIFYPKDFEEATQNNNIVIDKVIIDGQNIGYTDKINLKYNQRQLQIDYFLPEYLKTKDIIYSYKLQGVDSEWIIAKNRRNINYDGLEAGRYELLIKARDSYGNWVEPIKINIDKKRAPWETPFAYFIYFFIISLIIYLVWNRVKLLDKIIKDKTEELHKRIEENEMLYEKTIQNEINKNNYFVNLSHELRTPLNIILSTEQLISTLNKEDKHINKERIRHYMNILRSNANRLLKLINDIIDTSKIESGYYKLNIIEHNIIYHVEEIVFSMKDFIESKGIEFIVDPEVEEKIIECDIGEIEKCIINLLSNATKFTSSGGKIEIVIEDLKDRVKIAVKDTGIGIDKNELEAIFNRFGQAYNKKTEEFGGSGIGLYLTKQLVTLHNGELLVKSELGKGSTFTIVLPVKQL